MIIIIALVDFREVFLLYKHLLKMESGIFIHIKVLNVSEISYIKIALT